jgi:peptide/nickel transport system substrate-binding protein
MLAKGRKKQAVTRVTAIAIVVVLVVGAAIGAYSLFLASPSQVPSTTQATTQPTTQAIRDTLVIDDLLWPLNDLNMLYMVYTLPWPDWYQYSVYQPLVGVDPVKYKSGVAGFVPSLAEWTVSSDGTTYTFNLRQDVKFSNGDPLNAYQVWMEMYGFYYLSANSSSWWTSYDLFDMSKVNFGPDTISMISGSGLINPSKETLAIMENSSWPIYVTGPYQIIFHLKAPFAYFTGTMVVGQGLIFDTQFVLDHGGFGTPASINTYFNQVSIPGTGPYVVTEISVNNFVKFAQDPNYWGLTLTQSEIAERPWLDPGHVKNVVIYYKTDDLARYSDLVTGTAQIAPIQSTNWNLILANPTKFSYLTLPPGSAILPAMAFNTKRYPTNIPEVRLAIAHAINYEEINKKVFNGQLDPIVGPEYPYWKEFYDLGNYPPYTYNLTLAKDYLAKAKIKDMPTLTFTVQAGLRPALDEAELTQAYLAELGIPMKIEVLQASQYIAPYGSYPDMVKRADQIGHLSPVGGTPQYTPYSFDPAHYWATLVNEKAFWGNWAIYSHPSVQACIEAFTSSSDITHVQSVCEKAQTQIYNDAPYIWLGTNRLWLPGGSIVWLNDVVSGFYVDPLWGGGTSAPIFNTVTFRTSAGTQSQSLSASSQVTPALALSSIPPKREDLSAAITTRVE